VPFKDPEKQKEYQRKYQRDYQRFKRSGEKPHVKTLNPEDIQNAKGLRDLLSSIIAEVMETKADTLIKARCIGYLVSIGLKAVETADLEERIRELEETTRGGDIH